MPFESDDNVEINITVDDGDALNRIRRINEAIEQLAAQRFDFGPDSSFLSSFNEGLISGFTAELNKADVEVEELSAALREAGGAAKFFGENAERAAENTRRTGNETERTTSAFSQFGATVITLNQGLQLLERTFNFVRRAVGGFFDALGETQRIEGLSASFERLQESVGLLGSGTLDTLRTNTQGLVSDLQLLEVANNAVLLGVEDGSGRFAEYTDEIIRLGQAAGRTATQAINDFTTGVGRASPRILDNLGIIIDANQAYDEFAATLGVTAEALNDTGKDAAIQEAAFQALEDAVANLGDIQSTAALETQRLQATISNLTTEFLTTLSANQNLTTSIRNFSEVLASVDVQTLASNIAALSGAFIDLATTTIPIVVGALDDVVIGFQTLKEISDQIIVDGIGGVDLLAARQEVLAQRQFDAIQTATQQFVQARERFNAAISSENVTLDAASLEAAERAYRDLAASVQSGNVRIREAGQVVTDARQRLRLFREIMEAAGVSTEDAGESAEELRKQFTTLDDATKEAERALRRLEQQFDRGVRSAQRFRDSLDIPDEFTAQQEAFQAGLEGLTAALITGSINTREFDEAVAQLSIDLGLTEEEARRAAQALQDLADADLTPLEQSIQDINDGLSQLGLEDTFLSKLAESLERTIGIGSFEQIGSDIAGNISSGIIDGLQTGDFQGAFSDIATNLGATLGQAATGALTASLGPVGTIIGSAAQPAIDAIAANIGEIGESLEDTVFGLVDTVFPGLGTLGEQFLGDFVGDLFGDTTTPGQRSRENFRNFFAQLADEADFTSIFSDLDISDFGTFTDELGNEINQVSQELAALEIPQDLFNQFLDLGTALDTAFDFGQEGIDGFAGQLGQLLALNLQDPLGLNELQLLFAEAGVSAEQLQQELENAFLQGDLSASQFLGTLQATRDVIGDGGIGGGIPGAVGDIGTAFANLEQTGAQSGTRLLDAVRDIGFEAQEAGIPFEQLGDSLLQLGFDAEQVNALLQGLAAQGITTFEQLQNIDVEGVANLSARLEEAGFQFEELGNTIDDVRNRFEQFRAEAERDITTNVVVNVEVNDPEGGLEAAGLDGQSLE